MSDATLPPKGREELSRLKQLRIKSIGKIVTNIRAEIFPIWEELGVGTDEQRECEFPLYFVAVNELDDKSVDSHEQYLAALKARVEELRPLLAKISKREAIVLERIELEHIQLNPERLTARGPKAREDRKREEGMTTRVKNIDRNTKEILTMIAQWEEKHGEFRYAGQSYIERVTQQDESYFEIRDSLRNARRKKDGKPEMKAPIRKSTLTAASKSLNNSQELNSSICSSSMVNDENQTAADRNSRFSDSTEYTSATEVKERESVATSATLVKMT